MLANAVRNPDRILLVRLSHLGDVVHALGVFHALHAAYPAAEIAWAVQSEFAGLLAGLPGLARVFRFERRGGLGAWLRLRAELVRFRPDWTVDAQGNAKSGAAAWLSRAPRRIAPHRADWQEPWAAWTANEHAAPLLPPARHAMQRMQLLAARLVPGSPQPLRLDAGLSPAETEQGERALAARSPRAARDLVMLHLSSPGDVRGWPAQRWRELVRALRRRGHAVLVLSGPAEAELGRALERELEPDPLVAHWVGQSGLRELAAVFAAAARRALTLVACDSGPLHLAAAHGLRVLALEGPQDAARTGPWPADGTGPWPADGTGPWPAESTGLWPADTTAPGSQAGLRHRSVRSSRALECAPCLARRCRHAEGPVCMHGIAAEDVLAALERAQ